MIEPGYPPKAGEANFLAAINPHAAWAYNGTTPIEIIHAQQVAAVMISTDPLRRGVAQGAYLDAVSTGNTNFQSRIAYALNDLFWHSDGLPLSAPVGLRAVNASFSFFVNSRDGSSYLTKAFDWAARTLDTVIVVAGVQRFSGGIIPRDNFNGITVAATSKIPAGEAGQGTYAVVSSFNDFGRSSDTATGRVFTSLVAPGDDLEVPSELNFRPTQDWMIGGGQGTSFAAPHVTAAVALLDQFGERKRIAAPNDERPFWNNTDYRNHLVFKAVLLNSADKVRTTQNTNNSDLLDMDKTISAQVDPDSPYYNFITSPAFNNPNMPLDLRLGAGQLNVARAVKQYENGERKPTNAAGNLVDLPNIGWDYNAPAPGNNIITYHLGGQLKGGSYVNKR